MDILKFCEHLNALKHLKRAGWVRLGIPEPETVACHMYRMAMLAWVVDDAAVDRPKCIKMALVHDLGEAIVGDITPLCNVSSEEKFRLEEDALAKITALLPTFQKKEIYDLWMEYEENKTSEAILVHDLDKFDMISQAFDYEKKLGKPGYLQEFFDSASGVFRHSCVKGWVETLNTERSRFVV